jgi:hypothetical protein
VSCDLDSHTSIALGLLGRSRDFQVRVPGVSGRGLTSSGSEGLRRPGWLGRRRHDGKYRFELAGGGEVADRQARVSGADAAHDEQGDGRVVSADLACFQAALIAGMMAQAAPSNAALTVAPADRPGASPAADPGPLTALPAASMGMSLGASSSSASEMSALSGAVHQADLDRTRASLQPAGVGEAGEHAGHAGRAAGTGGRDVVSSPGPCR